MWLDVHIPKNRDIPFDVKQIAKFEGLSCGIIGCKPVVLKNRVGKYTRMYDEDHLGVAIEIHEEEKTIEISLNYPAGRRDVKLFFHLIEEICTLYHTNTFSIYDEEVSIFSIEEVIDFYLEASSRVLKSIYDEILDGKRKGYVCYGALYPVVLGLKEFENIQDDIKEYALTIEDYQNMDINYAEADIYTVYRSKKHYGVYEMNIDKPYVLPLDPNLLTNLFDCELYEWTIKFPWADFKYQDFLDHVEKKRFDEEHVIVQVSEEMVDQFAKEFGYDPIENVMIYHATYGIPYMDGITHARKVRDKELKTNFFNGYTHVAYLIRWFCEHNLLGEKFLKEHPGIDQQILDPRIDLRLFIFENKAFNGRICPYHLNEFGRKFAYKYCIDKGENYPSQVDKVTEMFIGKDEFNNPAYKEEAYLFMEPSEAYYQELAKWLDSKWKEFIGSFN